MPELATDLQTRLLSLTPAERWQAVRLLLDSLQADTAPPPVKIGTLSELRGIAKTDLYDNKDPVEDYIDYLVEKYQ